MAIKSPEREFGAKLAFLCRQKLGSAPGTVNGGVSGDQVQLKENMTGRTERRSRPQDGSIDSLWFGLGILERGVRAGGDKNTSARNLAPSGRIQVGTAFKFVDLIWHRTPRERHQIICFREALNHRRHCVVEAEHCSISGSIVETVCAFHQSTKRLCAPFKTE